MFFFPGLIGNDRNLQDKVQSRDNNFDLIRFLAASLVIFSHSYQVIGNIRNEPLMLFSKGYIYLGTLSVIIFFIISGFLITRSYIRSRSLRAYIMARVLRIYPGLICATLVSVFIIGPIFTEGSLSTYLSGENTYIYLLNVFCLKMQFHITNLFVSNPIAVVNGCLWSLPYELSCYWLVAFFGQLISKRIINAILMLFVLLIVFYFIDFSAWKNIILFSFYFACGSAYYFLRKYIYLNNWLAIVLFILVILVMSLNINRHFKDIAIGLVLPYVIISFAYTKSVMNNFSKQGDFSYGIYIYGWPVQQIIVHIFPAYNHWGNFALSFLITMILAYASWHLVEKRFLKFKTIY